MGEDALANEKYALKKPFDAIGGDHIEELCFSWDAIRAVDYRQILRIEARIKGTPQIDAPAFDISLGKATSAEFRMAAAWLGALRGTKGICMDDLDRLCLLDLLALERYGLLFFGGAV